MKTWNAESVASVPTAAKAKTHGGTSRLQSKMNMTDWKLGPLLGEGQFGRVILARHRSTHQLVAWKRFSTRRLMEAANRGSRLLDLLQREVDIHQSLDHPHILKFLGFAIDPRHVILALDYADGGDLFDYTVDHNQTLMGRLETFRLFFPQVLSALSYLENCQVAHRDIKPENILLLSSSTPSSHPTVKVADFGWSIWYFKSGARQSTLCGTPEYLPPELLTTGSQRRSYEAQYVDAWALGVLGLELLQGETPFAAVGNPGDQRAVYCQIREFAGLDRSTLTWTREPAYASMLDEFLQRAPLRRLSASAALERYGSVWGLQSTPKLPTVQQRKQVFQRGNQNSTPSHSFP